MSRDQLIFLAVELVIALLSLTPWLTPSDLPYATRWAITGGFLLLLVVAAVWYFRASVLQAVRSAFNWCYWHSGIVITLLLSASATAEYLFTRNLHSLWPFLFLWLSLLILRFGKPTVPSDLRLISVPGQSETGANTGLHLRPGHTLIVSVIGEISIDDGRNWYSPKGIITRSTEGAVGRVVRSRNTVLPNANAGAMIGWIGRGNQNEAFLVGPYWKGVVRQEGNLFLAVNDIPGQYGDNDGRFLALATAVH